MFENFRNIPKNNQNFRNTDRTEFCGCKISQNFARLFEEELFFDAVLEVKGRTLNVHKLILASESIFLNNFLEILTEISNFNPGRSPVLKIMIDSSELNNGEKEPIIIENFEYRTIQEMIRYIYTEKVQNIQYLVYDLLDAAKEVSFFKIFFKFHS